MHCVLSDICVSLQKILFGSQPLLPCEVVASDLFFIFRNLFVYSIACQKRYRYIKMGPLQQCHIVKCIIGN